MAKLQEQKSDQWLIEHGGGGGEGKGAREHFLERRKRSIYILIAVAVIQLHTFDKIV